MTASWAGRAWGQEPGIWGEVIMRQPFDAAPFRQVEVPAWVQETTGCGYTLSGMDSQGAGRGGRAWGDHQRDGLRRPVLSPTTTASSSSDAARTSPSGGSSATSPSTRSWASGSSGVYPPCLQGEVYEDHPDWRRIATDTTVDPPDRHEEVPARRDALPARALRRLLHRRPGRDPHEVPGRRRLQLRRAALRRRLLLPATAATTTARTPGRRSPGPT